MKLTDAVLLEKTPEHYLNVVAVKTKDQGAQWAKDLEAAFRSAAFKQVVDTASLRVTPSLIFSR